MSAGFIYFVTMEPDEYVKIGWAKYNPWTRMNSLQTGCPEPLRLMAAVPGSREEERRLHETFAELHYRGEWFFLQHKLYDLVQFLDDDFPRETKEMASRERFEDAISDVAMTGYDHPLLPDPEAYRLSGDGSLWRHMHPEFEEA